MTAVDTDTRELAAAIAETLDIPLPGVYTARTMEQHRQLLLSRTLYVQGLMEVLAGGGTFADAPKVIREAIDRYPVTYATDDQDEEAGR